MVSHRRHHCHQSSQGVVCLGGEGGVVGGAPLKVYHTADSDLDIFSPYVRPHPRQHHL